MKKTLLIILFLCSTHFLNAQVPQKMSYQAVIRNSSNALVTSTAIGMRVSIIQGSTSGTEVYKEVFTPNPVTNANGLVSIEIGAGSPVTGTFANINWANGPYFIKTETDPTGGTNYTITGISQLLSVPYALYAGNVVNYGGKQTIVLSDTITNAQAQAKLSSEFGPNTQEIRILGCINLTAVDLTMFTKVTGVYIANNTVLQTINLSSLLSCEGDFVITNCPSLTSLDVSSLESLIGAPTRGYNFEIENIGLTNLNFPKLKKMIGIIGIRINPSLTSISFPILTNQNTFLHIEILGNNNLTNISLPVLNRCSYLYLGTNQKVATFSLPQLTTIETGLNVYLNNLLSSISFPLLTNVGDMDISNCNALTSISFPALTGITSNQNSSSISTCPNLTSISFNNLASFNGVGFNFNSNKLPSSQINALLNKFVSITPVLTNRIFYFNQNPVAPPTGQGIIDKATLISRGNSVTTD